MNRFIQPPQILVFHMFDENRKWSKLVREKKTRIFEYGIRYRIFRRFFLAYSDFLEGHFSRIKTAESFSKVENDIAKTFFVYI